jgi:hypothetical protein
MHVLAKVPGNTLPDSVAAYYWWEGGATGW